MIRQALAGRRLAVTGATGFLGTALVERLVRSVPDCEVVVVVRPGRRGAADRVRREILRNDCFDRLRGQLGDRFDEEMSRRILPVAGDVGVDGLGLDDEGRALLATCTTVIHSAAAVSFDAPLDSAVQVNLLGPSRVAAALSNQEPPPHLIAVSTAYVAGTRRGVVPEAVLPETPFAADVAWRPEVAAADRARDDADAASRDPKLLTRFSKEARAELGAAGVPALAAKAEKLREQWVKDRMIDLGKGRARALGWPDAYAYTKALGERALLENRGQVPVTIVRPSIIESALAEPRPGWIRGFRMAEPVIISYGRGLLKEFPGIPEGVVDVIPVDLVVAAILAVAAKGPAAKGPAAKGPAPQGAQGPNGNQPEVFHVASGARNPLRYRQLTDLVRTWFLEHPLADSNGQPIVVPEWSFPGRGRVQRQLQQATRTLSAAEKVLQSLPIRGRQAELAARLEQRRDDADRALGYVELYGSYTETEAIFGLDRLIHLWGDMDDDEHQDFCFDPSVIDWPSYIRDVHMPSVVAQARVRTVDGLKARHRRPGGSTGLTREERGRRAVLSPDRQLAVFDLENTLIASNVVESYAWLATRGLDRDERVAFTLRTLREAPRLLALDRQDRGDFLRYFYRRYDGAPASRLRGDANELWNELLLKKSFPAGIRRVREHRRLGHRTLLITGALEVVIEPLRPLFDDIVCARLGEQDGRFTGELETGPPTGEARALIMADYATAAGLELAESVAYADSASDLPMLEAVGHPVAVNPETKLAAIARKRGWHVEHWPRAAGGPRPLLPLARSVAP
jgi:HAD superfamily hydrolase (TIGR01490 family)